MRRLLQAALFGAAAFLLLVAASTPRPSADLSDSARVPAGLGVPSAPVTRMEGVATVGANDLARLLGASRTWRADVRKLMLRSGDHRITLSADNPFVIVDDRTVRLSRPVTTRAGELQVPVELARLLPEDGWPRLAYDPDAHQLRVAPKDGFIGSPRVETGSGVTAFVIPAERAEAAAVVGRSRARFRVRVAGALSGVLPDSLPDDGLLRDVTVTASGGAVTFELALDPSSAGYRLERDPEAGRVTVTLSRNPGVGLEPFADEGAPGPRVLRVVVLDPGHGGDDAGATVEGAEEKTIALDLALRVADELQRRGGVRVELTRRDDRGIAQETRAETANRTHADAVLSLHVGDYVTRDAAGCVAWVAPAERASAVEAAARAAGLVNLTPWRDVAYARAVESRGLAEAVTTSLERAGFGPGTVRERLPLSLVGITAPGVLLECGSLANPEERARLQSQAGLMDLARAIADGVLAWQRGD